MLIQQTYVHSKDGKSIFYVYHNFLTATNNSEYNDIFLWIVY